MSLFLVLLVVGVGMLMPAQAGINAELRNHVGHPLWAAVTNFVVGLAALLVAAAVMRVGTPQLSRMAGAPGWAWLGGLCGSSLVLVSLLAAPRLGATLLIAGLVAGQLGASVLIDHFGWVHYPVRPVNWVRVLGLLSLALGVFLIERSK